MLGDIFKPLWLIFRYQIFNTMEISYCFIGFMEYFLKFKIYWWVRVGGFSKVVATFNHVGRSFLLPPLGCLNNPIFSNLGFCAVCWAHFMCHSELWPTSVEYPFSFLNSSLGLTGGKHTKKVVSLSLDFFFKILLFHVTFLIFFSIAVFSPFCWLACYCSMWLYLRPGN